MTALAEEAAPVVVDEPVSEPASDPDEVLWQAWKAVDLPEGYRAGIPVYVVVDDFDDDGAVLVLTSPDRKKGKCADEHRVPYGTDAVIPEGPVKGFAIGKEVVAS